MSKKKAIKKIEKAVSKVIDGTDAKVLINVYSPGHEPKEFRITIPNICGTANLQHRSPESLAEVIIEGLRAKYGGRVG